MSASKSFVVREATPVDCQQISVLIEELNRYEDLPNSPHVDARALEEHGFGEQRIFKCFVATETCSQSRLLENSEGDISGDVRAVLIGYVLFCYGFDRNGKHVYMEDLYVTPAYRSKGVGTELWRTILKLGLEAGARSCRFCVLASNGLSIAFYRSKGAQDATAAKGFHFFGMTQDLMEKFVDREAPKIESVAVVRPAKEADVDDVLKMQHHLEATLGEPGKRLTREELCGAIFSSTPTCYIVVAEDLEGRLQGYVMFSLCFTTWQGHCCEIYEVYVKPDSRRLGVGFHLLQHVMKYCLSLGCLRCDFLCAPDNLLSAMFDKLGAVDHTIEEGWLLMFMDKEAMVKMVNSEGKISSKE